MKCRENCTEQSRTKSELRSRDYLLFGSFYLKLFLSRMYAYHVGGKLQLLVLDHEVTRTNIKSNDKNEYAFFYSGAEFSTEHI